MTSPPEQNRVNEGRRGPTRVHRIADPITTNQKAAGSSPAERATKILRFAGLLGARSAGLEPATFWFVVIGSAVS